MADKKDTKLPVVNFVELTQKQVEDFARLIPDASKTPGPVYDGETLRAAIKAGWIADMMDAGVVDSMKPGKVAGLSNAIWKEYNRAREIDPS